MNFQQTSKKNAKELVSLLLKGEKIAIWCSDWCQGYVTPRYKRSNNTYQDGLYEDMKWWVRVDEIGEYSRPYFFMCSVRDQREHFCEEKTLILSNSSSKTFKGEKLPERWSFFPDLEEFIKDCYALDEEGNLFLTLPSVVEDRLKKESFFKSADLDRLKNKSSAFLNAEGWTPKEIDWIKGNRKAA